MIEFVESKASLKPTSSLLLPLIRSITAVALPATKHIDQVECVGLLPRHWKAEAA